jgi:signal peptidase II
LLYYALAILVIILDQASKWAVAKFMEIGETIPIWEGVFHLTSHRNAGAAFGILQNQRWFFIVTTLIVIAGIILYLRRTRANQPLLSAGLAFILGGAIGNFIDRLFFGKVVDFFHFVLIDFPIFNVADSAITIGVSLIILDALLDTKKNKNKTETNQEL